MKTTSSPSPVQPVAVPATYRFVGTAELDSEIIRLTKEGSLVIGRITLREPFRSEMLERLNSHAANLAKIAALKNALRWTVAELVANHQADSVIHAKQFPESPPLREPDSLAAARAALAL